MSFKMNGLRMSKLKDHQVKEYQYGSPVEGMRVLAYCAKNPTWPVATDKETIERMIIAAGMKTRRYVYERDGDTDPRFIEDTFKYVWFPIAEYESSYLTYTVAEFKTEEFQESSIRNQIDEVIYRANNSAELRKKQNSNNGKPQFMLSVREGGSGQNGSGNGNGQQKGGGSSNGGAGKKPKGRKPLKTSIFDGVQDSNVSTYDSYNAAEEDDPYDHQHRPCGCKHCNRGNKVRCHVCCNELSQADLDEIKAEKEAEKQRKRDEAEKAWKERQRREQERKAMLEKQKKVEQAPKGKIK